MRTEIFYYRYYFKCLAKSCCTEIKAFVIILYISSFFKKKIHISSLLIINPFVFVVDY